MGVLVQRLNYNYFILACNFNDYN